MKTIILIDSIKENPTAGRDRYAFPGRTQVGPDGSIFREITEIRSMTPESSHIITYKPTNVKCENCGKEFYYKDLKSDCMYDDDGEDVPIGDICPKCMEPDCCNYAFEAIEEFLRRKK